MIKSLRKTGKAALERAVAAAYRFAHSAPDRAAGRAALAAKEFAAASSTPRWSGMGTTLVAAALCQDRLAVAHVGDSRLYRLRSGRLERLTRDHSFAEDLLARGYSTAEALRRAESKALTRALGPSLEVAMPSLPTRTYSDPVHSILTGVIPVANALVRFVHAKPSTDVKISL